ncbi:Wzz/FepE/Etk N-terminal domain-containing protein [Variovorax rhizosphaerae]|uniref:Wzz/FepE/Etk N-terminal domain-containing protein n=1 Tax=Variovorax rhizosphaerae TaxID=1836200 RepID=A0ABU8WIE1_9BURK
MFWRNGRLVASCTVLVSALALGLYFVQVPVYTSTARLLVQIDQIGTPSFLSGIAAYRESQLAEPVSRKIETEMALVLNRTNAMEVVDKLGIQPSQLPVSPIASAKSRLMEIFPAFGAPEKTDSATRQSRIASDVLANMSIEPVRSKTAETTSNVLEVRFSSTDPDLAPRALEGMLDAYLRVGSQQNRRLGTATTNLLKSQIESAQAELKSAEDAMVQLAIRESHDTDLTASATLAGATTGAAGTRRETGRGANQAANAQLVVQYLDLQSQLDELRQTFTDETDGVRKLKQRVADMRARLASQVRSTATNTAAFNRLERQRSLALDRYVELRRKFDQIDIYMQLTPAALDGRIVVDPPSAPDTRQAGKKKLIALAGPVAGLLLGLLLVTLKQFIRPRLQSRREVERLLGVPVLGTLPTFAEKAASAGPPDATRGALQ